MKRKIILFSCLIIVSAGCFLKVSIAESLKSSGITDTSYSVSKDSLLSIIKQQNDNIAAYKSLKEEMTAKEVFEKSKSYLITWISIGGLAVLFAILFGYFATIASK